MATTASAQPIATLLTKGEHHALYTLIDADATGSYFRRVQSQVPVTDRRDRHCFQWFPCAAMKQQTFEVRIMFSPLSESALRNPHSMYDWLRETAPFYYDERLKCWIITKHRTARKILCDHRTFTVDFRRVGEDIPIEKISVEQIDPPEHRTFRQALALAFRELDWNELHSGFARLLSRRLDLASTSDAVDFIGGIADPVADYITTTLLGITDVDRDAIRPWLAPIVDAMDSGLKPEAAAMGALARQNLTDLLAREFTRKRRSGLIGWLQDYCTRASVSTAIIVNTLRVILHSGYTSVPKLLANALHAALNSSSHILGQIHSGEHPHWVREFLRFAAPVHAVSRVCTSDTEFGGNRIRRNQDVVVLLAAANRDPDVFNDPHTLLLDRDASAALTFGTGIHHCLGAAVAAFALEHCLTQIAERFPRTILLEEPRPLPNAVLRGPVSLLIRLQS